MRFHNRTSALIPDESQNDTPDISSATCGESTMVINPPTWVSSPGAVARSNSPDTWTISHGPACTTSPPSFDTLDSSSGVEVIPLTSTGQPVTWSIHRKRRATPHLETSNRHRNRYGDHQTVTSHTRPRRNTRGGVFSRPYILTLSDTLILNLSVREHRPLRQKVLDTVREQRDRLQHVADRIPAPSGQDESGR
jgi:hypothetical protein